MQPDRLDELVADGMERRQRTHRLLEHQADLAAADRAHLGAIGGKLHQVELPAVGAAQQDLATDDAAGRSTMRRIERAVTLLPQPDSPTMPSVGPGRGRTTRRRPPHHALVRRRNTSAGHATESIGSAVRIGGVAQAVAQEVERQDRDDHRHRGSSSHGEIASVWTFCACCSITPQEIAGGRRPRPRKLSEVSLMIIAGSARVTSRR